MTSEDVSRLVNYFLPLKCFVSLFFGLDGTRVFEVEVVFKGFKVSLDFHIVVNIVHEGRYFGILNFEGKHM